MGSDRSTVAMLLLMMFTLSSAHDMSIISYDQSHPDKSTSGSRTDDEVMALYEEWLVKHGKAYNGLGEKERRFEIFKDNLKFIDEHNADESHSYKVGLNRFADLTNDEYRATYLGKKPEKVSKKSDRYAPRLGESLPDSVDWRKSGAVAEVKDQGSCDRQTHNVVAERVGRRAVEILLSKIVGMAIGLSIQVGSTSRVADPGRAFLLMFRTRSYIPGQLVT